jgi:Ca2+-binding EF-hand superfamily protein
MNLTANPTYSAYELVENPNKSTSTAEEPKANENVILGDVTGDGKIDSRDAVVILKDFASTILGNKTTLELNKADMNSDGKINSSDAVEVLKTYANSLISK